MMGIDGEDLRFKDFVKMEIVPDDLEVIVDFNLMVNSQNYFLQ
jgi:hypothetical protein